MPAWQADEPLDPSVWLPLTHLALEGFGSGNTIEQRVANLARELSEDLVVDDIGRQCVPRSVARELFALREEKARREAERRGKYQDDMRKLSERNRKLLQGGQPARSGIALADIRKAEW
ncbi:MULTISPECIES: hypothetical protein [Mycobacteroides]|uniref:hypothetical protein n=1 Tax=Mycobacteroides TaxID=670516 RepID=UPI00099277D3|nr:MULTISPECIES: hypothetical protein [Mycobacteroides]